jgi:amidase
MQAPALDAECAAAVRDAAKLCESLGHHVEEATIPGDVMAMQAAAGVVIAASVAAEMDAEAERRGRPVGDGDVEALTMASYRRGKAVDAASYVRSIQALHAYARTQAQLFESYDVLLLSTLGSPAIPIGWITEDTRQIGERLFAFMPNTQAFNNTGQPAMTVPLAQSRSGLPIGIQFVARMGAEATLFSLAGQLERAAPWMGRTAPI